MGDTKKACLICGEELNYLKHGIDMDCEFCHNKYNSNACCVHGHYVCDSCHGKQAIERIREICLTSNSTDPLEIAVHMMNDPYVHMHGNEHHVLVGAALLAAFYNAGGKIELTGAFEELRKRGSQVPGGVCGFWGCCGAAVSSGIFISIITGSTPLSIDEWGLANRMTSASLKAIGEVGGARCCKRDSFLAIEQAIYFCREHLGVAMKKSNIQCQFFNRNKQCIGSRCPYNKHYAEF